MRSPLLALAALTALAVFLLGGATADAQTRAGNVSTQTYVQNTGQTESSTGNASSDHAQAFTTGSRDGGFGLWRVGLLFQAAGEHGDWDLQLWSDSSGNPGQPIVTLHRPGQVRNGVHYYQPFESWSPDGIVALDPDTTYWLVWNNHADAGDDLLISKTASDSEGAEDGWSLSDFSRSRPHDGGDGDWVTSSESLRISVEGWGRFPPRTDYVTTLLSNAHAPNLILSRDNFDLATSFTTGDISEGYTLTAVGLRMTGGTGTPPGHQLRIHSSGSNNRPGTQLAVLSQSLWGTKQASWPDAGATGFVQHFPSVGGLQLAANTTYWVVSDITANPRSSVEWTRYGTRSNSGDDAARGWSIGNSPRSQNWNHNSAWTYQSDILIFRIHGYANGPEPADDAAGSFGTRLPDGTTVTRGGSIGTEADINRLLESAKTINQQRAQDAGHSTYQEYLIAKCRSERNNAAWCDTAFDWAAED